MGAQPREFLLSFKEILDETLPLLAASAITWLFTSVVKLRHDMAAAFKKIRALEETKK